MSNVRRGYGGEGYVVRRFSITHVQRKATLAFACNPVLPSQVREVGEQRLYEKRGRAFAGGAVVVRLEAIVGKVTLG